MARKKNEVQAPKLQSYKTITIDKDDELMLSKPYVCVTCGKRYSKQKGNFSASQSELYTGNNSYLPTCIRCLEKLYDKYKETTGSEIGAIMRICLHYDLYYDEQLAQSAIDKTTINQSTIRCYVKNCNLVQYKDKTYDTTLSEDVANIRTKTEFEEAKSEGKTNISKAVIDRFGVGIGDEEDYRILDSHYKMLKSANPNCDSNQEVFIKALCNLQMLSTRALRNNDRKGYTETNAEYMKTFKQAGLKLSSENTNTDDCWGLWMEQISKYTPEEYYKDKNLFTDYDNIGDFFSRHILRPLRNLLNKENVRDKEYNVGDESE